MLTGAFVVEVSGRNKEEKYITAAFLFKTVKKLEDAVLELANLAIGEDATDEKDEAIRGKIGDRVKEIEGNEYFVTKTKNGFLIYINYGYVEEEGWGPHRFFFKTIKQLQEAVRDLTKAVPPYGKNPQNFFLYDEEGSYTVINRYGGFQVVVPAFGMESINRDELNHNFFFMTLEELQDAMEDMAYPDVAERNTIGDFFTKVTDYTITKVYNGFLIEVIGYDRKGEWTNTRFVFKTLKELQDALEELARLAKSDEDDAEIESAAAQNIGKRFSKVKKYTVINYANGFAVFVQGVDREGDWTSVEFFFKTLKELQDAVDELDRLAKSDEDAAKDEDDAEIESAAAQNIGKRFSKVKRYTVEPIANGFKVEVEGRDMESGWTSVIKFFFKTLKELQAAVEELARLKETAEGTIGERLSKVFHYKFQADNNGFKVEVEGYDREGDRTSVEFFFKTLKELQAAVDELAEKMVDD